MFGRLIFLAGALAMLATATRAQDGSWWAHPEVSRCCSVADALYADKWVVRPDGSVLATVTAGGPRDHDWAPIGREYEIPADKVIDTQGDYKDRPQRPILFVRPNSLEPLCFVLGPMI